MRFSPSSKEVEMAKAIIVGGSVGFCLLLASTIALVILNWSERTLTPVLSIVIVGTATMLAAVLVSLKQSTSEDIFTTSVVLDATQGMPAFVNPEGSDPKVYKRLRDLITLGRPFVEKDGKPTITVNKPNGDNEEFAFCGELLQYQILLTINKLQRGSWTFGMGDGVSFAQVSKPMKLSRTEDYPGKIFLPVVASNRFSNSSQQRFFWEHGHFPLPKNTSISLIHQAAVLTRSPEKHIVKLKKPMFFTIDFTVEPIGGTNVGLLPKGVSVPEDLASRSKTYHFKITIQATFERITAGNEQTQEYKDWVNWLAANLRESVGD
jgi:hypothetical protein